MAGQKQLLDMGGARNFPTGADSFHEGLKHGFQGTLDTTSLRKNSFSPSDVGGYSPLALPWRHPMF